MVSPKKSSRNKFSKSSAMLWSRTGSPAMKSWRIRTGCSILFKAASRIKQESSTKCSGRKSLSHPQSWRKLAKAEKGVKVVHPITTIAISKAGKQKRAVKKERRKENTKTEIKLKEQKKVMNLVLDLTVPQILILILNQATNLMMKVNPLNPIRTRVRCL